MHVFVCMVRVILLVGDFTGLGAFVPRNDFAINGHVIAIQTCAGRYVMLVALFQIQI